MSLWVTGTRADREAHIEALARSGRCTMAGGRCMVEADGGPMGRLRIEVPGLMCNRLARAVSVVSAPRLSRFQRTGAGLWDVVGLDRRGVERYRVSGYGSEDEARRSLAFHPRGTALAYSVRYAGRAG